MEYSRDGSGNEGEGGTVAVREGRSTRREVARQPEDRSRVIQRQRKFAFKRASQKFQEIAHKMKISQTWSLSSSKSNTVAGEIMFKWACQKSVNFGDKNEDISESVCSFDFGAIFRTSLGHKLSRNAFVVSILFSERISY